MNSPMNQLEHMATVIDIALNARKNIVHIDEIDPPDNSATDEQLERVAEKISQPLGHMDVFELISEYVLYSDLKNLTKAINSKDHAAIGKALLDSIDKVRLELANEDEGIENE